MRRLFIFLMVAVLGLSSVTAVPAEDAKGLKVGAWNIEWLGNPDSRRGPGEGVAQNPEDIAAYIKDSRVQLLCLEEICDSKKGDHVLSNDTLGKTITILNDGGTGEWRYRLFRNKTLGDRSQVTGVMWNGKAVTPSDLDFRIPVKMPDGEFNYWDRWPTAAKFRSGSGKTDVVVIPIHMKSGGSEKNRRQRAKEAASLIAALSQVKGVFSDQDVVIVGDFNVGKAGEDAVNKFVDEGYADMNASDESTVVMGGLPLDRAFVPKDQQEFQAAAFEVVC